MTAEEAIQVLAERSKRNFLYVAQALQGIERDLYGFDRLDQLPPGLDGLFADFLRRHFPTRESFSRARSVFKAVLAGQEAPTEELLAAATRLDADDELPELLAKLAVYLPVRQTGGTARYHLVHSALGQWLADKKRARRFYVNPQRGHERLADAYWREYEQGVASMSPHSLRHLPHHLAVVAKWDRSTTLLTDPPYLEARVALQGTAKSDGLIALANDLTQLAAELHDPCRRRLVRLLDETLRLEMDFLSRHPGCLFQVMWNNLWWHDAPGTNRHYEPAEAEEAKQGAKPTEPAGWVSDYLQKWRAWKEQDAPGFVWLRSLRPPFEAPTGDRVILAGHESEVVAAAVTDDPPHVLTATANGCLRLWDADRGRCIRRQTAGETLTQVFLLPDARQAVLAFQSGQVVLWDFGPENSPGSKVHTFWAQGPSTQTVELSSTGRRLAAAFWDL